MLLKSDILFRAKNAKKENHSNFVKKIRDKDIKYSYLYRATLLIFIAFILSYFLNPYDLLFLPEKEYIMSTDGNLVPIETMEYTFLFFITFFIFVCSGFFSFRCLCKQRNLEKTKIQNYNEMKESDKEYFKFIKNNIEELFQEILEEKDYIDRADRIERMDRMKRYNQDNIKLIILSYEENQLHRMNSEEKFKKVLIEERLAMNTIANM